MYVYRITMISEDGKVVDLSWPAVKERCIELGVNTVPDFNYGEPIVYAGDAEALLSTCLGFIEEADESTLCSSHIREGVGIRVEHAHTEFFKYKSFNFGVLEGYLKDNDEFVDIEEAS